MYVHRQMCLIPYFCLGVVYARTCLYAKGCAVGCASVWAPNVHACVDPYCHYVDTVVTVHVCLWCCVYLAMSAVVITGVDVC